MDAPSLNKSELSSIIRYGAEAIFNEDQDDESLRFDDDAIGKLLDRDRLIQEDENESKNASKSEESGSHSFGFTQVWNLEKGESAIAGKSENADLAPDLTEDANDNFWDKLLGDDVKLIAEEENILDRANWRKGKDVEYTKQVQFSGASSKLESANYSDDGEYRAEDNPRSIDQPSSPLAALQPGMEPSEYIVDGTKPVSKFLVSERIRPTGTYGEILPKIESVATSSKSKPKTIKELRKKLSLEKSQSIRKLIGPKSATASNPKPVSIKKSIPSVQIKPVAFPPPVSPLLKNILSRLQVVEGMLSASHLCAQNWIAKFNFFCLFVELSSIALRLPVKTWSTDIFF